MPLQKMGNFEQHPSLSLRTWKKGTKKEVEFLDDGRDVTTKNGLSVVYTVRLKGNKIPNSIWIRPGGALHIGVNEHIPLVGKTLVISKEIEGDDILKGTRYSSKVLESKEL